MTRYFINVKDAVEAILKAIPQMENGQIFVPNLDEPVTLKIWLKGLFHILYIQ